MSVVTKTGDDGTTWAGSRVPKDSQVVELLGELDELNAHVGFVLCHGYAIPLDADLTAIQDDIMTASASIISPRKAFVLSQPMIWKEGLERAQWLESRVHEMEADLPELKNFILPRFPGEVHVARVVCRRVERRAVTWQASARNAEAVLIYLNRLSDYLFTAARWISQNRNQPEKIWPGVNKE